MAVCSFFLTSVIFLVSSRHVPVWHMRIKIAKNRFLPHPHPLAVHFVLFHSTLHATPASSNNSRAFLITSTNHWSVRADQRRWNVNASVFVSYFTMSSQLHGLCSVGWEDYCEYQIVKKCGMKCPWPVLRHWPNTSVKVLRKTTNRAQECRPLRRKLNLDIPNVKQLNWSLDNVSNFNFGSWSQHQQT
jgi:hypothetical protein